MAENTAPKNNDRIDLVSQVDPQLNSQNPVQPLAGKAMADPTSALASGAGGVADVQSVRGMTNVVDALFTKGLIDQATLKSIKFESLSNNKSLEQVIHEKGILTDNQVQETKAEMYGFSFIDLDQIDISQQVLTKIDQSMARKNMVVVFEELDNSFKLAMIDPLDLQKVKFLESILGKQVEAYFASPSTIQRVIDTRYGAQITEEVSEALEDVGILDITSTGTKVEDISSQDLNKAPVSKIVNMIVDYAIKHDASDAHIEPRENKVAVRYRVHGILSEKLTLPPRLAPSVISRIKILSNLKIDEHRVPQDGRFQVKSGDIMVDIRVSVMPSVYGEKVVMRFLERDTGVIGLSKTGLRGPAFKRYSNALKKTQGIILISGPTGSGKTVTLASSLAILNRQEVNIVTVEDPVEIRIDGITQVQVNQDVGLNFATALRSFLRQDPDIIMVGEIRDKETAELAVQAALTGHLVLATIHTNSAAGALPRLLDMDIQPFLLASTIEIVGAQRLVRELCDECKEEYEADNETLKMLHETLDGLRGFELNHDESGEKIHFDSSTEKVKLYKAVGCPQCSNTGYSARIGIFEVMPMSDQIGRMIMKHQSANEINDQAIAEGMITMVQDGFMKALEGITSIEEVLRVQSL